MRVTDLAPAIPVAKFKRSKIIVTVGPATNSYEAIRDLIMAGANGLRLNFSHGTHPERTAQIKWIRKASRECGKPVAVIQDLQGPKMRLGDFEGIINVLKGQSLSFQYQADFERSGHIPTQFDLSRKVKRGERLYLYDGKVRTVITSVKGGIIYAEAENDGILIRRKGLNLPDTDFDGDIITDKDKTDLAYGSTQDVDYVALSFVQSAADIRKLRVMLKNAGNPAKIIAKVETKIGVANIEEIVEEADAVMIARGDLAVETLPESVPIVQQQIIKLGLSYAKPTIVATQILASMTEMPEPTRAEVSDIATAVAHKVDCLMLSDETANGQYPIEAVRLMKRVILYAESHNQLTLVYPEEEPGHSREAAISSAVLTLAENIKAQAIVAETKSGATALEIAKLRPNIPIIAVTPDSRTAQQLAIVYDVKSYVRTLDHQAATKLTNWLQHNKALKKGDIVVTASSQYPGVVGTTDTIKVRILQ